MMARGKKKEKALTPEEKLAQALVPEGEQPYQVPENWCWVHLEAVLTETKNGTTIKQDKSGEGYSVTRIESLQNQTIDFNRLGTIVDSSAIKDTDWYQEGDIALSHINSAEHVGKTALITSDMLPLVHGMNLLRLRFNAVCLPRFYQYYSQSFQYKSEILDRINMAVNQVSINQKQLGSIELPLPPVKEQQHIVDRIESLFAKLDEAKEKAQAVLDSFETRKAAILHKAFTGELTAKWRADNQSLGNEWTDVLFDFVADAVDPHPSHRTPPVSSDGIPYIGIAECNYNSGEIDFLSARKVSKDILSEHLERYHLSDGDFIIGKIGTVGKPFKIPSEQTYALSANVVLIKPDIDKLDASFLFYYFQSDFVEQQFKSGIKATTQAAFGIKKVRNMSIRCPFSMQEQKEVVRILDSLLAKEQQAKEAAEAVLEKIDLLKKSILARAFRGELGTNDPTDEPAIELLKRIL